MKLRDLAHARSGDKGDVSNISVIAYDQAGYEQVRAVLTPERVKSHLRGIVRGEVRRFDLPNLLALNFVLNGALGGGVTRSLALDAHGKCLSGLLLELDLNATEIGDAA
ncbi:AtuA-related protein [Caulobacter sp.]|uniref:AtuA-related protein n=1 Tax=Caulobacter sp. TaxID=78 RepID=UPI003BAF4EF9